MLHGYNQYTSIPFPELTLVVPSRDTPHYVHYWRQEAASKRVGEVLYKDLMASILLYPDLNTFCCRNNMVASNYQHASTGCLPQGRRQTLLKGGNKLRPFDVAEGNDEP